MTAPFEFRFPAVSSRTADFYLSLPPFLGFSQGWSGTLEEFLAAIRRGDIDLQQAPLVAVVDQYLHQREQLGLDEAGEYLDVTASLIQWKTRLLLPRDPVLRLPDPREKIVKALENYGNSKQANVGIGPPPLAPESAPTLSLLDLMLLLQEVQCRAQDALSRELAAPEITVADKIGWVIERLGDLRPEGEDISHWFALQCSPFARLCLFLALLELSKQGRLRLEQSCSFGPLLATQAYKTTQDGARSIA